MLYGILLYFLVERLNHIKRMSSASLKRTIMMTMMNDFFGTVVDVDVVVVDVVYGRDDEDS